MEPKVTKEQIEQSFGDFFGDNGKPTVDCHGEPTWEGKYPKTEWVPPTPWRSEWEARGSVE